MAKPIIRWALALFTATFILVSLYNASAVRDRILSGRFRVSTVSLNSQWARLPIEFPVKSYHKIPTKAPLNIPKIQHDFPQETEQAKKIRLERLGKIEESFKHAWKGYKDNAWLKDEVAPVTGGSRDTFGGWAATLVDSLDTLWIMGLHDEFDEAVNATSQIDFSVSTEQVLNVFETTIRYMGGFLAAYDLSGRQVLLDKAIELGEMIYVAFDTPNRMPLTRWRWEEKLEGVTQAASVNTLSAEIGSFSLELTRLTQLTGDPKYYDAIARITDVFEEQQHLTDIPGLWPINIDALMPDLTIDHQFSLGAMADSLYEYLPKEYMLLGGHADQYKRMYEKAIDAAKESLFFRPWIPGNHDVLFSGLRYLGPSDDEGRRSMKLSPEGQHLVCFAGGMVGIGAKIFSRDADLAVARKLVDGCIWSYEAVPKGIMPEVFEVIPCEDPENCEWDEDLWVERVNRKHGYQGKSKEHYIENHRVPLGISAIRDHRYVLRPEAIESVFIMYRITGDPVLMEKGWTMFEAIEKATRTEYAHAALHDITDTINDKADSMESFWTAETLKYFYLLFSEPGVISLDEWVFNTEAHGLKRPIGRW